MNFHQKVAMLQNIPVHVASYFAMCEVALNWKDNSKYIVICRKHLRWIKNKNWPSMVTVIVEDWGDK